MAKKETVKKVIKTDLKSKDVVKKVNVKTKSAKTKNIETPVEDNSHVFVDKTSNEKYKQSKDIWDKYFEYRDYDFWVRGYFLDKLGIDKPDSSILLSYDNIDRFFEDVVDSHIQPLGYYIDMRVDDIINRFIRGKYNELYNLGYKSTDINKSIADFENSMLILEEFISAMSKFETYMVKNNLLFATNPLENIRRHEMIKSITKRLNDKLREYRYNWKQTINNIDNILDGMKPNI